MNQYSTALNICYIPRNKIVHETNNRVRIKIHNLSKIHEYQKLVSQINGVSNIQYNEKSKSMIVYYDANPNTRNAIVDSLDIKRHKLQYENSISNDKKKSFRDFLIAAFSLLSSFVFPPSFQMLITIGVTTPLLYTGTKELFLNGLNANVLETLAVFISITRREFKTANITHFLLASSKYLEDTMVHKTNIMLLDLMRYDIEKVWVYKDGEEKEIAFGDLSVGDIVIVNIGDVIPVDGMVSSGVGLIDQSSIFGESVPVTKEIQERVYSGTVLVEGKLKIFAEKVGQDTTMYEISEYVKSALECQSKEEIEATKIIEKLVPINLFLAFLSYLHSRNWITVAAVLQADYSCAIKLSIPVSFKSAIFKAGVSGILIKDSKALENLSDTDVFVFDKTGTLTEGNLEVEEIIYFDNEYKTDDILSIAASIEEHHFHPIAKAIVQEARQKTFKHFHHSDVEFIIGHGVNAYIGDKKIYIGSKHYLEDHENISFEFFKDLEVYYSKGKTLLFLGINDKPLGIIVMQDKIRQDALVTLENLKNLGVKDIILLTGDEELKTKTIAESLGISRYYAQIEPTEKAEIIKQIKKEGKKIAFVGDGINDSPALVSVDVGISMGTAADISKFTSDIVLLNNELSSLYKLRSLSSSTRKKIKRNFFSTVAINSSILGAATLGYIQPYTTSLLHNGATIMTLLNSMKVDSEIFNVSSA